MVVRVIDDKEEAQGKFLSEGNRTLYGPGPWLHISICQNLKKRA